MPVNAMQNKALLLNGILLRCWVNWLHLKQQSPNLSSYSAAIINTLNVKPHMRKQPLSALSLTPTCYKNAIKDFLICHLGLLDYGKNHNDNCFGQYY